MGSARILPVPSTETIRALLAVRGYSLSMTADAAGVNRRTVVRMLNHQHGNGKHHPPEDDDLYWSDLRVRIADVLGLEPADSAQGGVMWSLPE